MRDKCWIERNRESNNKQQEQNLFLWTIHLHTIFQSMWFKLFLQSFLCTVAYKQMSFYTFNKHKKTWRRVRCKDKEEEEEKKNIIERRLRCLQWIYAESCRFVGVANKRLREHTHKCMCEQWAEHQTPLDFSLCFWFINMDTFKKSHQISVHTKLVLVVT